MLMSIDQSLNCTGVILWFRKGPVFRVLKPVDRKVPQIERLRQVVQGLSHLLDDFTITEVVIESLPYGARSTSVRPLAALYYFINNLCLDYDVPFHEANVSSVKKFATGKGNAKKPDMIEAFKEHNPELYARVLKEGYKKTTGLADIADAYFIGLLHKDTHG